MSKFVILGGDDRASAFLDSAINAPIPSNAIAISDALWAEWIGQTATAVYVATTQTLAAYVPPATPAPTAAQLIAAAQTQAAALIAAAAPFTAAGVTISADSTAATMVDIGRRAVWGAANPTASQLWLANDNSLTAVTGAQFAALAPLVEARRDAIIAAQAMVVAAIAATPPTITTLAGVAGAAWPN